jgi:hypothetical protein
MWMLVLLPLLLGPQGDCIRQARDRCRVAVDACPRPVFIGARDRSCRRCGVAWMTGTLDPDALVRLVAIVHRQDRRPIASIAVTSRESSTTAVVDTESGCEEGGSGAGHTFVRGPGGAWRATRTMTWVE